MVVFIGWSPEPGAAWSIARFAPPESCAIADTPAKTGPGPQLYPVSAIDYLTGYLMAFGAMVALARRVREGGSWLVRISLAQTGRWLVGRGQVPEAKLEDVPKEFTRPELVTQAIAPRVG